MPRGVNLISRFRKGFLLARAVFAATYARELYKQIHPLIEKSKDSYRRAAVLREMAWLAHEANEPFRSAWLRLCGKLLIYRGDWSLGRARRLKTRVYRWDDRAKALRHLLGHKMK